MLELGKPTPDFPHPWSIRGWIDGRPAGPADADSLSLADELAAFLHALWRVDASGGPAAGAHSFWRGGSLQTYDGEARAAFAAVSDRVEIHRVTAIWDAALASPSDDRASWVHGDIAPGNLLMKAGRLVGVIDFGCCAVGDPACDLAVAWAWFDAPARAAFASALGASAGRWARARGWALWKAAITLAAPGRGGWPPPGVAARTLEALLTEETT